MKQDAFVDNGRSLVSRVVCDKDLRGSIERSVELIGGVDKLVKKDYTILLKPNYNTADPFPGSSDPNFIKAIINMLYEAGAGKVIIGERSAFLNSRKVLEKAGIIEASREVGAEVVMFGRDGWRAVFDRRGLATRRDLKR